MDDNEIRDLESELEGEVRVPPGERKEGIPWAAILVMVWAVALVVFAVQNAEATTIDFLGWSWQMPVALLVMITALVTLVLTAGGSAVYRRRRRRRRDATGER
ncbi:MAG TPA: lipopolysaccharide assembly protein LapA domain-containing protein [Acidimicrobiia bacterium]|nr:lipopolysaccharide assembly protein LapA domain-containing protein [Acidimicrobiia bacterium]